METNTASKVFIVDDDPFSLTMYQHHLYNLGYTEVSTFSNGLACLTQLSTQQPDIIFLDHDMGAVKGMDVLKKIKDIHPNTFVVFISGQDDVQVAVDSLKYGAFDYIVKGDNDTDKIELVLHKINQVRELQLLNQASTIF